MAFYLSLLEGPTPAQAVSIFATGDSANHQRRSASHLRALG